MNKYTTKKDYDERELRENPFDLLNNNNLVDNNGGIQTFYKVNTDSRIAEEITLKDFVNTGIDIIQEQADGNNNDNGGDYAQIGSSGDYAQIGSSGYSAKIGSSGDYAQIGSSGYYAKIGSSGYSAKIGSSGDYAQIGSSGYSAKIGSSGDSAKIGSSGDYAQIGSSGYSAKIGSSGDYAQIGSSGDYAKIDITGENSIGFACGFKSQISGAKGTWFALAEYERNKSNCWIPVFAKVGQIENKDYKDCFGKMLKSGQQYELINKEFAPVKTIDGSTMVIFNKKKVGEFTIYKAQYRSDFKDKNNKFCYVAQKGEIFAHGETIKQAVADVEFKFLQTLDVSKHVERVKKQGFITPNDYRLLTGACQFGTNKWLKENGFTWEDKKSIDEVIELTKGQYGHERLVELLKY